MNLKYYVKYWVSNKSKIITYSYRSIYDIDWEKLMLGKELVIFDIDDTLGEHEGIISEKAFDLLQDLRESNISISAISNSPSTREKKVEEFFFDKKSLIYTYSDKPNPLVYQRVLKDTGIIAKKTVVIGDRAAIDLYGAFLAGIPVRVLVKPYSECFGGRSPGTIYKWVRDIENSCATGK